MAINVGIDSYVDVATADTYFGNHLFADAWNTATVTQKEQALKMATKAIDRQPLKGIKKDPNQKLQFPRCYRFDPRNIFFQPDGTPLYWEHMFGWWCETDVPQAVKDATCEEALAILERGNSTRIKLQKAGVSEVSMGDVTERYLPGSGRGLLSPEVKELLRPYLAGAVNIT